MARKKNGVYNDVDRTSADKFEGYVTASLESIKADINEVKETMKSHVRDCDEKIICIEKKQSKLKDIYIGVAAVIGAIMGFIGRFLK
jgi:hypothetical protein